MIAGNELVTYLRIYEIPFDLNMTKAGISKKTTTFSYFLLYTNQRATFYFCKCEIKMIAHSIQQPNFLTQYALSLHALSEDHEM